MIIHCYWLSRWHWLAFCGMWFFSSMRTALNTIYGVRVSINPLFGKLKDFGMILLVVVFYRSEF